MRCQTFSSLLLFRLEQNSCMSHYCVQLYLQKDFSAYCTKIRSKLPREVGSYMNSLATDSTVSTFTELHDSSHYSQILPSWSLLSQLNPFHFIPYVPKIMIIVIAIIKIIIL